MGQRIPHVQVPHRLGILHPVAPGELADLQNLLCPGKLCQGEEREDAESERGRDGIPLVAGQAGHDILAIREVEGPEEEGAAG